MDIPLAGRGCDPLHRCGDDLSSFQVWAAVSFFLLTFTFLSSLHRGTVASNLGQLFWPAAFFLSLFSFLFWLLASCDICRKTNSPYTVALWSYSGPGICMRLVVRPVLRRWPVVRWGVGNAVSVCMVVRWLCMHEGLMWLLLLCLAAVVWRWRGDNGWAHGEKALSR